MSRQFRDHQQQQRQQQQRQPKMKTKTNQVILISFEGQTFKGAFK